MIAAIVETEESFNIVVIAGESSRVLAPVAKEADPHTDITGALWDEGYNNSGYLSATPNGYTINITRRGIGGRSA